MTHQLRAGVAGAGVFGGFHAGKYAAHPRARLAGVFDRDLARAQALAGRFEAEAFDDYAAFLAAVEVVSVTAAASAHGALGLGALAAGRHAYIEKPLATDAATGAALVRLAAEAGLVLACGHQERLTLQALGLLQPQGPRPRRIEALRAAPPSGRGEDVSVFLDLMIHDADFALALTGSTPERLGATVEAARNGLADAARLEIRLVSGAEALLTASRVAHSRERRLRLFYPQGLVEIDFLSGAVSDAAGFGLPPRLKLADPLGAALDRFLLSVLGEAPRPAADGADGLAALKLVLAGELASRPGAA